MNKSNRKHLRWLIPLIIYYVIMAITLRTYWIYSYSRAVEAKENEIAFDVEMSLDNIDFSVENAMSRITQLGESLSLYTPTYNKNQITLLLKNMVEETELSNSFVCDLDGVGYDMDGRDINVGETAYFGDVTAEYSRGGVGMILPDGQADMESEILIINGITYSNKEKGYLISSFPVIHVSDQLFKDKYIANRSDIVTIDGDIVTFGHSKKYEGTSGVTRQKLWNDLPAGISKDTIKLSISQKNLYMSDVPDYGYVIVVPFRNMAGAVVTFITEDEMRQMVDGSLQPLRYAFIWSIASSLLLVLMIYIANVISNFVEKKKFEKDLTEAERDVVTGLMTRASATRAIDNYINETGEKRGILFVVGLNSSDTGEKEDIFTSERLKEFSRSLEAGFRVTDILGRISDNEFLVFLKDIHEEKDLRKQTDHMQMFLHDVKVTDGEREFSANAGAALFPDSGKNAADILNAAESALIRSRKDGIGMLSF